MSTEQFEPNASDAIKEFLIEHVLAGKIRMNHMKYGVDVSDPHFADMEALRSKVFSITNVRVTPSDSGNNFHCYIGQTELHFARQAAADIRKILEEKKS